MSYHASAKKIQKSREAAIARIKAAKKKLKEEIRTPEALEKQRRLNEKAAKIAAQKAEKAVIVLPTEKTYLINSENIRGSIEFLTRDLADPRIWVISENNLFHLGQIYLGTHFLEHGVFSEIPNYVELYKEIELGIMDKLENAQDQKRGAKLIQAYIALKSRIDEMYESFPEADLQRVLKGEAEFMEKYRVSQLSPEEQAAYQAEIKAKLEIERELETERQRQAHADFLMKIELDKIAAEQLKIAKEEARLEKLRQEEEARSQALSSYLANPDDFWNTPDEPEKKSRRRRARK